MKTLHKSSSPEKINAGFTAREQQLIAALFLGNGQKTIEEIGKRMGLKRASAVTAISQLRARFKASKIPFVMGGRKLDPKSVGGQGRRKERVSFDDMLKRLSLTAKLSGK